MDAALPDDLPLYGVQLVDAYLLQAQVLRRPRREGDEDGPTLEATLAGSEISEDAKTFHVSISANVNTPYREGAYFLQIECTMNGRFESPEPKALGFWESFAGREALAMLWPFVRSNAWELGRMTGLPVPMLPTLDVKAIVPPRGSPAPPPQSTAKPRPRRPRRAGLKESAAS